MEYTRINSEVMTTYISAVERLGKNSIRHYISRITIIRNLLKNNELPDKHFINSFIESLVNKGLKNNSINSYINAINLWYRLLIYYQIDVEDFTLKCFPKNSTYIEVLTIDEINKLIYTSIDFDKYGSEKSKRLNDTESAFTMFLATTGCRFSEAANLRIKDVDFSAKRCVFHDTKNKEWRYAYLNDDLLNLLKIQIGKRDCTQYVFVTLTNNQIIPQNYNDHLKLRADKVGIKKRVHPHLFRHSFATQLIVEGWTLEHIRVLTGHKDLSSLQKYLHLADSLAQEVAMSHPLNSKCVQIDKIIEYDLKNIKRLLSLKDSRFKVDLKTGLRSLKLSINTV